MMMKTLSVALAMCALAAPYAFAQDTSTPCTKNQTPTVAPAVASSTPCTTTPPPVAPATDVPAPAFVAPASTSSDIPVSSPAVANYGPNGGLPANDPAVAIPRFDDLPFCDEVSTDSFTPIMVTAENITSVAQQIATGGAVVIAANGQSVTLPAGGITVDGSSAAAPGNGTEFNSTLPLDAASDGFADPNAIPEGPPQDADVGAQSNPNTAGARLFAGSAFFGTAGAMLWAVL